MLSGGPDRSNGRALLEAAWAGGARACGVETGQIEVGMRADVVVLAADVAFGLQGDAALDMAVFAARGNPVRHAVAGGECVVRDGRHRLDAIAAAGFGGVLAKVAEAA